MNYLFGGGKPQPPPQQYPPQQPNYNQPNPYNQPQNNQPKFEIETLQKKVYYILLSLKTNADNYRRLFLD